MFFSETSLRRQTLSLDVMTRTVGSSAVGGQQEGAQNTPVSDSVSKDPDVSLVERGNTEIYWQSPTLSGIGPSTGASQRLERHNGNVQQHNEMG